MLAKGQGVHAMGDGDTCMVQAFNDELRELQRFEEKISSAYHRVQPAFETLSPDILEKIVRFIDRKQSAALSMVSCGVRAGVGSFVHTKHVPALTIQNFWRTISPSKSLMQRFQRTRLSDPGFVRGIG
jgi:hypothetical protein